MSKTIRTKVYQFDELYADAQKKAIDHFRYANTEGLTWYEYEYANFANFCETIGIEVDLEKTYWRGFSSQGDGVAITADIDLKKLVEGIEGKVWEGTHGTKVTPVFNFDNCPVDKRVLMLIYNHSFDCGYRFIPNYKGNRTTLTFECYLDDQPNISGEVDKLERWLEGIAKDLDRVLYKWLENEYDHLTGDEAVKKWIIREACWFTQAGTYYPGA